MFRNLWFQLHWILGITAGVILAVVGVTGGLLSFEQDILRLINPGVMTVTPGQQARLSPDALRARIAEAAPERQINALSLVADANAAATVNFAGSGPTARRGETVYLDPYTGELLGTPRGREFFLDVMRLHRWLLAGDVGKQIVGASTVALIVLCLSGLYLRWPRHWRSLKTWLTFSFVRKGRGFLWDMHAVVGTWVLLLYLLMSVTGLYWSYEWYRNGLFALAGVERPAARGPGGPPAAAADQDNAALPSLDSAWQAFERQVADYSTARLQLPQRPGQPVTITYLDPRPAHERATNRIVIDTTDNTVVDHERYEDKPLGQRLMSSMLPLHSGSYFGKPGLILMMLASLGMPLFAITGWMLYLDRRSKKKTAKSLRRANEAATVALENHSEQPVLIAFASQSGTARNQAWMSAGILQAAGLPVVVRPLSSVGPDELGSFQRALFSLATFGAGEPPDNARGFMRRLNATKPVLSQLRYGLLSLGDSGYEHFCGFGRHIDKLLRSSGAQPWFEPVEVDDSDAESLTLWQQRLATVAGSSLPLQQEAPFDQWRLSSRTCLNPHSSALPCYHLELQALDGAATTWRAGDIAEIRIPTDAHPLVREYSIASVMEDGCIQLLVRQVRHANGEPGPGSAWLCSGLEVGAELELRIRKNSGFHGPQDDRPMILIGNGSGIAGLRAHLKERIQTGHTRNWLIFGERQAAHDFHYREDILAWLEDGMLQRLDLAFSRDQPKKVYVQHHLQAQAELLKDWLRQGAAIYVCGSVETMAPDVDRVLCTLLGDEAVEELYAQQRYQRDIY